MKKSILLLGVTLIAAASCGKYLDVTPPNSITDEQIKELMETGDAATKQKIVNAIAAPMIQYFNLTGISGQGVADAINTAYQGTEWARTLQGNDVALGYTSLNDLNDLAGRSLYAFNYDYTQSNANSNASHWFGYALGINKANFLLSYMTPEAIEAENKYNKDNNATQTLYHDGRVRGLVTRAYSYLCLMEEYQMAYTKGGADKLGMSLYTVYDPGQANQPRSSAKETYEFIIADLKEAVSLLKEAKIGVTKASLEDFDLGLVNFVLARAALNFGDYATCIAACQEIINSGAYSLIKEGNWGGTLTDATPTDPVIYPETNAFYAVRNNPECILGFVRTSSYIGGGQHTSLANPFNGYAATGTTARIDDRLYNKIDENDFRKAAFLKEALGDVKMATAQKTAQVPSYVSLKYAVTYGLSDDGTTHTTNDKAGNVEYCKFRLAEVYLMLAEAQCANNQEAAAKATINTLLAARTKAGKAALTIDNYGTGSLAEKIQLQWRIEMWGEGGREYFNNKRWGVNVDRTNSGVHLAKVTYPYTKMVLNLPERELQDNSLSQPNE